jgi:hypothetical protein
VGDLRAAEPVVEERAEVLVARFAHQRFEIRPRRVAATMFGRPLVQDPVGRRVADLVGARYSDTGLTCGDAGRSTINAITEPGAWCRTPSSPSQ